MKVKNIKQKGFTLVELLVVIGIIGILAAALIVGVDPVDKMNAANDSKSVNTISSVARAMESFGANNNGKYASSFTYLANSGDLKATPPVSQTLNNYAYTLSVGPAACTNNCTAFTYYVTGLASKKYKNSSWSIFKYASTDGRACPVGAVGDACPTSGF